MIKKEYLEKLRVKNEFELSILFLALLVGVYFHWNLAEIFIFLIFISAILKPISSQIFAGGAFLFLLGTSIFAGFGSDLIAEKLAIYAYYFLVMTVIFGILEVRK